MVCMMNHLKERVRFAFDTRNPYYLFHFIVELTADPGGAAKSIAQGYILMCLLLCVCVFTAYIANVWPLTGYLFAIPWAILTIMILSLGMFLFIATPLLVMFQGLLLPILMTINLVAGLQSHEVMVALKVTPRNNHVFYGYGPIITSALSMSFYYIVLTSFVDLVIYAKLSLLAFIAITQCIFILIITDKV